MSNNNESNNCKNDNPYGINFSVLDNIREGIDRFLVDTKFLERFMKEFKQKNYDPQVIVRYMAELVLFADRWEMARYVRIKLAELGMEELFDTQEAYLQACEECKDSTFEAMARDIVELQRLAQQCKEVIEVIIPQKINALEQRVKDLEDKLAQALQSSIAHSSAQQQEKKKEREVKHVTEKEIDEYLGQEVKLEEYDEPTRKFKFMMRTMNVHYRKSRGLGPVGEEEVLKFVNGLEDCSDTKVLCPYVDRGMVQSGWVKPVEASSTVMCEVYSEFSNCLGNDGNKMKAKSIQNALKRYFEKKQE